MGLAGLLSLTDRRHRVGAPTPARARLAAAPAGSADGGARDDRAGACSSCCRCWCSSAVGIGLAVGLTRDPSTLPSALLDKPVPAFELPPLAGARRAGLSSADLKGRVSLVNVFASWCVPCRVEHPLLMALAERGVPIYGINYKDPPEQAHGLARRARRPVRADRRRPRRPGRHRLGRLRRAGDLRGRRARAASATAIVGPAAAARPRADAAAARSRSCAR